MSGRSTRRRSKTARALEAEEQAEAEKIDRSAVKTATPATPVAAAPAVAAAAAPPPKKVSRSATKSNRTPRGKSTPAAAESNGLSVDRSLTPSSRSSSRAASPASSTRSSSRRRSTTQRAAAVAASKRTSGANTPISRASRSSSVASNSSKKKTVPKLKLKTKLGRGYNPSLVNYKDSEYHYGSDFEDDDDRGYEDAVESEKSSDESDLESHDSDDLKVESDVDLDEIVPTHSLPQTPMPYWLREDEEIPPLELPKSSEDLLVPNQYILKVFSIYEILRRFHQILKLTPFRVEDFCAAVSSEEQSNLLSEVHMSLLKTIVRAEEANGVTFGPIDQKDSVNCVSFFMDSVTWPDCLRSFLQSDTQYAEILDVINSCEYPFAPIDVVMEKRVEVLNFLADQILSTATVRDFITEDGQQSNEEHCRVCHRVGEVLVCDTCPGVFHLACLDPPLHDVPEEEWRCYVCQANEVEGVTDCVDSRDSCRQDCLGIDRAGNKYWFLCRRLVVEKIDGTINYYSTVKQLEELSEVLDDETYEKDLWVSMEEIRIEMERQMDVTEALTNAKKAGSKKSYFEIENGNIDRIQKEREEMKQKEESDAGNKIQDDLEQMAKKEETDEQLNQSIEDQAELKRRNDREERLKKREINRGDGFQDVDDLMSVDKEEEIETTEEGAATAASATTTTTPATNSTSVLKSSQVNNEGDTSTSNETPRSTTEITLGPLGDLRVTRRTLHEISSGTLFFKLGQEGGYKSYINQFSTKSGALSKQQANEERVKKVHMSHKFSLTDVSTFKWVGSLHGNRPLLVNTLRQTMLQLESSIPSLFMHPNWGLLRKPWIAAVASSVGPRDFARALTVLQCCMKPCMMLTVWYDSLGHTQLKKITNMMKEDRKKLEKRERREKEEEDERLRPHMTHIKYTLGLKHQVAKQKGEEYRAHGQFGWLWLSASRSYSPSDASKLGLRAGPHRLAVKYSDKRDGTQKVVLMEPKAFLYLSAKQEELVKLKQSQETSEEEAAVKQEDSEQPKELQEDGTERKPEVKVDGEEDSTVKKEEPEESKPEESKPETAARPPVIENKRLEEALKNARLERQPIPDELLSDVVDVCAGLSNPTRVLYSKVAKKAKVLDDFLSRRQQLKSLEERRVELKAGKAVVENNVNKVAQSSEEAEVDVEGEAESKTSITSSLATEAEGAPKMNGTMEPVKENKVLVTQHEVVTEVINDLINAVISKVVMKSPAAPSRDVEKKDQAVNRVYSSADTSGKLYLKRIQSVADSKKQSKVVKYPLAPHFYAKTRKMRNILLLAKHDVKHMARKAGNAYADGFNYNAKINTQVWPYPCPRATFRTSWLFKTACMEALQTVGLQLRILWASIRWDDMSTRPISIDGKHQQTTDTAISTTEILGHRHVGRYQDKTQYLQRKVTIPLDVPKNVVEVTPIRSGLRKRKRAESPQQSEPKVVEEWIAEEKLELWEIRAYRERLEREKNASLTRSRTGTTIREPQRLDPSSEIKKTTIYSNSADGLDIKARLEEQIRLQRVASQNKAFDAINRTPTTPVIIRRVTNPDGSVSLVRSTTRPIAPNSYQQSPATPVNSNNLQQQATKKVFISKDGKIIGSQILPQSPGKLAIPANPNMNSPLMGGSTPSPQQKVQIVRSSDGKIQVRGLLPGQQLVQMPDGKLQIFTSSPAAAVPNVLSPAASNTPQSMTSTVAGKTLLQSVPALPKFVSPQLPMAPSPQSVPGQQQLAPGAPKQIMATLLPPGSPIPTGMTAFISGGKTYCIPKASTTLARQQLAMKPLPPAAVLPPPPNNVVLTSPQQQPQGVVTQGKQMVEVKSLGSNTVTFRGQQMIVSGPDVKEAQNIANLLTTGQARLATLGGKQVLISSTTSSTQKSPAATPMLPTQPIPVAQAIPGVTATTNSIGLQQQQMTSPGLAQTTAAAGIKVEDVKPPTAPVQVTAQLLQTAQGPRIVLQGIQGSNLPKEDLGVIQQQVKEQLLKAQAEAKQQGKVPPTKILIDLPPSIQAKLQPQPRGVMKTEVKEEVDVKPQLLSTASPQMLQLNANPPIAAASLPSQPLPPSKMLVVSGQKIIGVAAPSASSGSGPTSTQHQTSILLSNLTPTKAPVTPVANNDKFEVTPSYIQKAISDVLKTQKNLSPEIEHKLRVLQSHNADKNDLDDQQLSKLSPGDGDWKPPSGSRTRKSKSDSSPKPIADVLASLSPLPIAGFGKKPSPSIVLPTTPLPQTVTSTTVSSPPPSSRSRSRSSKSISVEDKKKQQIQSKLQATLFRQKEQLKKDIAKKRALQEKELQVQIHRDMEKIRQIQKGGSPSSPTSLHHNKSEDDTIGQNNAESSVSAGSNKRKRQDSSERYESSSSVGGGGGGPLGGAFGIAGNQSPLKKKKRHSSSVNSSSSVASELMKKDKVYCVCKTRYDPSKFYVGCDICSDWFHGSCVGITEAMSRNMTDYVCEDCQHAKDGQEIYCICRKPYDESRFYIGCEGCSDWFHGRCVGILQSEAATIDEYLCPNCDANSRINTASMKSLSERDHDMIKKLTKQILIHRNSWPFKQPVDHNDVPNYYNVVKEPMDLQTIETRVNQHYYDRLCDFVGDVTRIFENCRLFNQPQTPVAKCAESLEAFFAQKLVLLRDKIASMSS